MAGFYRSKYKPSVEPAKSVPTEGDNHLMFSTQFESSDARRAFPCFDEPNLKATFDFSIEIPDDLVALSNMPEKGTKESKNGLKVVSFERTPVMSTYVSQLSLSTKFIFLRITASVLLSSPGKLGSQFLGVSYLIHCQAIRFRYQSRCRLPCVATGGIHNPMLHAVSG